MMTARLRRELANVRSDPVRFLKRVERAIGIVFRRVFRQPIIDEFHKLFYDTMFWNVQKGDSTRMHWLGVEIFKCPSDLVVYQEIIHETRPDFIVECGTKFGGSALYCANICDALDHGRVITIDIEDLPQRPSHPRVTYLLGSTTDLDTLKQVSALIASTSASVMVILDSDHSKQHVLKELHMYSAIVTPGMYLIVEDTNVNGHPAVVSHGPGPMEAVREFLKTDRRFIVDRGREKLLLTFNPSGYLQRIK